MIRKVCVLLFCSVLILQGCKKDSGPEPNKPDPDPEPEPEEQIIKEEIIEISTDFGTMYMWLYKETPLHRENFLKLAGEGFYNNTTFHRIVKNFVIQGGDPNSKDNNPNNDGTGGPGYTIPAEFVKDLKNIRGAVATARNNNPRKESNGSQFYINLRHNTSLDGEYTVFGFIMKGMEVADIIVDQPQNASNNRPIEDIKMQVKIIEKTKEEIKAEYDYDIE